MVQRTVLKVDISCLKCKKKLLKAVSALQGVDKVETDAAMGTLTVTGDADPYEIIVRTRKAGKFAEVVSIGPPPAPPKKDEKKPEEKKPDPKKPDQMTEVYIPYMPYNCHVCEQVAMVPVGLWDEPTPSCSIL
ncbi:heavy metal-associated isoprenylated plant protein 43-like [Alnus glutinosa]|uniref:heavy metal-associated isoprenylated plant protein 43-like n=1 Tax=Alnus glutinosa TaxID=3517 RepID=UPI002D764A9B|nr:heavy metal-associated isoprenylated plant protein 43-like [Alnus glutinosa]